MTIEATDVATGVKTKLIVFVPGIGRDRSDAFLELVRERAGSGTTVVARPQRVKPWSVRRTPDLEAANLDAYLERNTHDVDEIVLIGHSLGGLIVRSAWLKGTGSERREPSAWPVKLSRIVLLGVPNGGFKFRRGVTFLKLLYALASPFFDFAIEHAKSGGYWVTNLRILWLVAFRILPDPMRPYVAEVIGVDDVLVTGDDLTDSDQLSDAVTFRIDATDHRGLVDLRTDDEVKLRWPTLERAIFGAPEPTRRLAPLSHKRVYFIYHGIRASAHDDWVAAMRAELATGRAKVVAPDTGYFSAFEFALPFVRNRKAHQFLEKYGDVAVTHDPDNFAFLGHSNGTYMLGRSMLRVPAVRFRNILLAGTVLNPNFDWELLRRRRQIGSYGPNKNGLREWKDGAVHNERVRIDVPVGVLSAFLGGLKPFNATVGTGGTAGFVNADGVVSQDDGFYRGGHAGALSTSEMARREEIAAFLRIGKPADHPTEKPSDFFGWVGRVVPMLSWIIIGLLVALLGLLVVVLWTGGLEWWSLLVVGGPLLVAYVLLRTV
ncbi:alpha/beta hydrolase [Agromyces humatus]|uniref:Alpha/beta hydrolase n=1 Tax=Agromyces humatus TaxID=279573 RepID=A0ABN2KNP0_9MICO|nr:alpha/beta hydrolase [Agromyces humatus]